MAEGDMKHICMLTTLCFAVGFASSAGATDESAPGAASSQPQSAVAVEALPHAPTNWASVRVGMTNEEVRQLLGEPRSVFQSPSQLVKPVVKGLLTPDRWWPEVFVMATALAINPATYGGAKGYHEGWEYPRDRGPVFDSIYYVYLDENGKVVRLSKPSDPDRQPFIQITEAPLDGLISWWEEMTGVRVQYDPLLVKGVMVSMEGIEDPNMLEPRVRAACERNGLQLSKTSIDKKTVYTIVKKEPANKMPGRVP